MAEPTIAAGFAKGLMDLAVSKGASQQLLIERSHISLDNLLDQDNRIPMKNYLALMEAGMDLCNDPALSLHFGEAFRMPELSIVGLISQSAETTGEAFVQVNRYARLMLDEDGNKPADLMEINRNEDEVWLELTSDIYINFPQLTESAFARMISGFASFFGDKPFVKAVHFTHAEPNYCAEYDRIFKVPVVFDSDKNALLIDETFLSIKNSAASYRVL